MTIDREYMRREGQKALDRLAGRKEVAALTAIARASHALRNNKLAYEYLVDAHEDFAELIAAASALTVLGDGRGYFESGAACNRFRAALAKVSPP